MRRFFFPCACVLALLTGAWFGQAYTLFAPSEPVGAADTPSQLLVGTAWRFYDAVDILLRTGDDGALRAVVAPEFVDHAGTPVDRPGRDGLVAYLASLRATHPALHLSPHDVIAQDDRVVAQVTLAGGAGGSIMGIPVGGPSPWPAVEIVRIEGDQIVERWGSPAGYASHTPVFSEVMTIPSRGNMLSILRRVTFAPGASDAMLNRLDHAVIFVEAGELDAAIGWEDGASAPADQTLGPGNTLAITDTVDIALRNRTDAPTVILLLSLAQPTQMATNVSPIAFAGGIEVRTLAGNTTAEISNSVGKVRADLVAITLAPGMLLSSHRVDGEELVAVDAGTLTVTVEGGAFTAWVRDPDGRSVFPGPFASVEEGSGLAVSGDDAWTSYRNETDRQVAVLLLMLAPG